MIEQVHKRIEDWERCQRAETWTRSSQVPSAGSAPSVFAMFVMAVSFLPVLVLQEKRDSCSARAHAKTFAYWPAHCSL